MQRQTIRHFMANPFREGVCVFWPKGALLPNALNPASRVLLTARVAGVSKHHTRALNQQGKVERYALSWLMHIDSPGGRTHFKPQDHPDKFHLLENRFPRHSFYVEEKGESVRIGCAIVDRNASPQNAARKTIRALQRFLLHGWFDIFIGAGLPVDQMDQIGSHLLKSQLFRKCRANFSTACTYTLIVFGEKFFRRRSSI